MRSCSNSQHDPPVADRTEAVILGNQRGALSVVPDQKIEQLDVILTDDQKATGRDLALEPSSRTKILKHAAGCRQCSAGAADARDYVNWALGPGLAFADDDERRRMVAAIFSQASDAPAVVAVAEPTVTALEKMADKPPSGGALPIVTRLTGPRLMNSITQIAHDPMIVRAIASTAAAVVLGICGLITASAPFAPPPARPEAMQPQLPLPATTKPADPGPTQNPPG
jgi:hypothetical protein